MIFTFPYLKAYRLITLGRKFKDLYHDVDVVRRTVIKRIINLKAFKIHENYIEQG